MSDEARTTDAVQDAVEQDRLLEGEDPSSTYLDDATHWIAVYTELTGVKRDLLRLAEERTPHLEEDARREVARTDLVILDAEMKRFQRRLEFWRRRCSELGGTLPPA